MAFGGKNALNFHTEKIMMNNYTRKETPSDMELVLAMSVCSTPQQWYRIICLQCQNTERMTKKQGFLQFGEVFLV